MLMNCHLFYILRSEQYYKKITAAYYYMVSRILGSKVKEKQISLFGLSLLLKHQYLAQYVMMVPAYVAWKIRKML